MNISKLPTPSIILDLDSMEYNIRRFHNLAKENGKEIWPMIKTHKSTEILKMQIDNGASGILGGTLDECEAARDMGVENIMYAYPVSDEVAIERVIDLSKKSNFIIRIDNKEAAKLINYEAKEENVKINYTVIVDSGLHRFGIKKEDLVDFVKDLSQYQNLNFHGISTHPGHVYEATKKEEVQKYVDAELETMKYSKDALEKAGFEVKYVTSGATPTFLTSVKDGTINVFHPGNYVFLDAIQMSLEVAEGKDCALRVLASITSNPRDNTFISDAGAKCLGLDKGAHGNSSIVGHGKIVDHSDSIIEGLSEEVGKIKGGNLKVGERVQIIPNHSCSTANLTEFFYGHRNGDIEKVIEVDIRGNSKRVKID